MAGSVYNVAIHLQATDGVSGVLASLSKSVLGLHGNVKTLEKGFRNLNPAILGAATAMAGMKIGHFAESLLEANGALLRQVNLFKLAGNSAEDAAAGYKAAYKAASQVPTVGVIEQFKLLREVSAETQDNKGSRAILADIARSKTVIEAATGRSNDEDMKRLFRFIGLRGGAIDEKNHVIDVDKFKDELQWATKALVAGQGLIGTSDLQQFVRQAGPAAKGITPEQLFETYLGAIEDQGGSRTGTSLTAVGRQFFGGTMTDKVAKHWKDIGMLNAGGWHSTKTGVRIDDPQKAIKGGDILQNEGFGALVEKVIRPTLEKHGFTSREGQNRELYKFASTETERRMMSLYLSSPEQIKAVGERLKKAMGSEGFSKVLDGGDYQTSAKAFEEAIKTLKTAVGDAAGVAPMLMDFAKGISRIADELKDHPAVAKIVTYGSLGVAGAATVGGGAMVGFGALRMLTGFGLPAAATQLTTAGVLLEGAAVKLAGGSVAGDIGKAAAGAGGLAGASLLIAPVIAAAVPIAMNAAFGKKGVESLYAGNGTVPSDRQREAERLSKLGSMAGAFMTGPNSRLPGSAPILDATKFSNDNFKVATDWLTRLSTAASGIPSAASGASGALERLGGSIRSFIEQLGASAAAADGMPVPGKQSAADVGRKLAALNRHPTSVGPAGTRDSFMGPGAPSRATG